MRPDKTVFRFILVGILNTAVGAGIMFFCYNILHLGYWLSSAANYILASILSYFLNRNFTFRYKGRSYRTVLRFALNIALCYGAAYGIAKPLVRAALSGYSTGIQENLAMLVGMCLFVALNYLGQRFFVFSPDRH